LTARPFLAIFLDKPSRNVLYYSQQINFGFSGSAKTPKVRGFHMKKNFLLVNLVVLLFMIFFCLGIGLYFAHKMSALFRPAAAEETEEDKTPPAISDIKIGQTTATSTLITWQTDEQSDSLVNFGLDKRYGVSRDPRFDKTSHEILLDELLPATTYYFRVISSDAAGNQGISSDYIFTTAGEEEQKKGAGSEGVSGEGKKGEGQTIVEETKEILQKITTEQSLVVLQAEIREIAEANIEPPTIILDLAEVEVGVDWARISWETDKEGNSIVAIASEADYRPDRENPYDWKIGEPDIYSLAHEVLIKNLRPATTYHFQVSSQSVLGLTGRSRDKTFRTKSVQPEIYNISITKIEEEAATISFVTNVPCSSILEYVNMESGRAKLEGNTSFITVHSVRLTNLIYDTYYSVVIRVESEEGEKSQSEALTFLTIKDKLPPAIAKVNTESTLYPGSENKIQTIASWETDELSACQFFYHQGLIVVDEGLSLPKESEYSTKHVQVATSFLPATVYKFWLVCADEVGNEARSQDFTLLTPTREESIIDIIIKNFESTFGWVKKFGK